MYHFFTHLSSNQLQLYNILFKQFTTNHINQYKQITADSVQFCLQNQQLSSSMFKMLDTKKVILMNEIFDIVYFSKGGFTYNDVYYKLPSKKRKFYHNKVSEMTKTILSMQNPMQMLM